MIKKLILLGVCVIALIAVAYASEIYKTGLQGLRKTDGTLFTIGDTMTGGTTYYTDVYSFSRTGGHSGFAVLSFEVDSIGTDSCSLEIILQEANESGMWVYSTDLCSLQAAVDWDTIIDFDLYPTAFWRIAIKAINGSDDDFVFKNLKVYSQAQ